MWKAPLKKTWLGVSRLFDQLFAYAQGGLRAVRRLRREIPTFRFAAKAPRTRKPRPVRLDVERLELRTVPTSAGALFTSNELYYPPLVPLGETSVDVNLGAVRLSQPLDFDKSPGTSIGGDPALVYNGATVSVEPIIQVSVTPASSPAVSDIKVQLVWDGTSQTWHTFLPANNNPVVVAVQDANTVAQTGRYNWQVNVEVDYSGGTSWTNSYTGRNSVVVQDSSVAGQVDPLGAGFGIVSVNRLVGGGDGLMYDNGAGDTEFLRTMASGGASSNFTSVSLPETFAVLAV